MIHISNIRVREPNKCNNRSQRLYTISSIKNDVLTQLVKRLDGLFVSLHGERNLILKEKPSVLVRMVYLVLSCFFLWTTELIPGEPL